MLLFWRLIRCRYVCVRAHACYGALQCVAVCCCVLLCVALCCSVVQCVAALVAIDKVAMSNGICPKCLVGIGPKCLEALWANPICPFAQSASFPVKNPYFLHKNPYFLHKTPLLTTKTSRFSPKEPFDLSKVPLFCQKSVLSSLELMTHRARFYMMQCVAVCCSRDVAVY